AARRHGSLTGFEPRRPRSAHPGAPTMLRTTKAVCALLCLAAVPALAAHHPRGRRLAGEWALHRPSTLATLSAQQARRLHGRLAGYRVTLATDDDREGKWDLYGCKSEGDVERTLWSVSPSGTRFPAFTEYRLTGTKKR